MSQFKSNLHTSVSDQNLEVSGMSDDFKRGADWAFGIAQAIASYYIAKPDKLEKNPFEQSDKIIAHRKRLES